MKRSKFGLLGLVLGGLLLLGAEAQAIPVTYGAVGAFSNTVPGPPTFVTPNGITITYNLPGPQTVNADPVTNVSFGSFTTSGTSTASGVVFSTPFTLQIIQAVPTPGGTISFPATISGTIEGNSSMAFLRFTGPLTQTIGLVQYRIANAALGVPGQILIGAPTSGPPNARGITAIEGQITVIPEPSAMVLMGMGAVAPLALMLRRRVKARAEA